jgi:hypothetical protein
VNKWDVSAAHYDAEKATKTNIAYLTPNAREKSFETLGEGTGKSAPLFIFFEEIKVKRGLKHIVT